MFSDFPKTIPNVVLLFMHVFSTVPQLGINLSQATDSSVEFRSERTMQFVIDHGCFKMLLFNAPFVMKDVKLKMICCMKWRKICRKVNHCFKMSVELQEWVFLFNSINQFRKMQELNSSSFIIYANS